MWSCEAAAWTQTPRSLIFASSQQDTQLLMAGRIVEVVMSVLRFRSVTLGKLGGEESRRNM